MWSKWNSFGANTKPLLFFNFYGCISVPCNWLSLWPLEKSNIKWINWDLLRLCIKQKKIRWKEHIRITVCQKLKSIKSGTQWAWLTIKGPGSNNPHEPSSTSALQVFGWKYEVSQGCVTHKWNGSSVLYLPPPSLFSKQPVILDTVFSWQRASEQLSTYDLN